MTKAEIDILKNALFIAGCEEVKAYKALPDEKIVFSESFEKNIQKLAKKRKSLAWQAIKTVPRRIAVVFIAAIITFSLMMSISAIRTPVVNFFVNVYDEFISIFIDDKDEKHSPPDHIETIILPSYMADGYTLDESQNYGRDAETYWTNDDGNIFVLYQEILENKFQLVIDNKGLNYQEELSGDITIYYAVKYGEYQVIWSDGDYLFTIICSDTISFNEIKNIINSMK